MHFMKRISFIMLVAFIMLMGINTSKAQVSVSLNIGSPPVWAPPVYAHTIRYYYIPEVDCYYDAVRAGYYYNSGPRWVFSAYLPGAYRDYDIASCHHVAVNYYGSQPYTYFSSRRYGYVQRYHSRPEREYRPEYEERHWKEHDNDRGREWAERGHEDGKGRWHSDHGHGHRD